MPHRVAVRALVVVEPRILNDLVVALLEGAGLEVARHGAGAGASFAVAVSSGNLPANVSAEVEIVLPSDDMPAAIRGVANDAEALQSAQAVLDVITPYLPGRGAAAPAAGQRACSA